MGLEASGGSGVEMVEAQDMKSNRSLADPGSATHKVCDQGQVTSLSFGFWSDEANHFFP